VKVKQEPEPAPSTSSLVLPTRSLTIEEEIARLKAELPPIDYEAAALDTFEEITTLDEYGEPVECTCTFREVVTYEDEEQPATEPVKNGDNGKVVVIDSDEDETDDFCAVEDEDVMNSPPPRSKIPSIFDPEYDANENVIDEMVRRKPRDTKVIEIKVEKSAVRRGSDVSSSGALPTRSRDELRCGTSAYGECQRCHWHVEWHRRGNTRTRLLQGHGEH
jgi:hypothetical protein